MLILVFMSAAPSGPTKPRIRAVGPPRSRFRVLNMLEYLAAPDSKLSTI